MKISFIQKIFLVIILVSSYLYGVNDKNNRILDQISRVIKLLELKQKDTKYISNLFISHSKYIEKQIYAIKEHNDKMKELLLNNLSGQEVPLNIINKTIDKKTKLLKDIIKANIKFDIAVKNRLTPAQWSLYRQVSPSWRINRRKSSQFHLRK